VLVAGIALFTSGDADSKGQLAMIGVILISIALVRGMQLDEAATRHNDWLQQLVASGILAILSLPAMT
jgi:hypothetical protein